MLKWRTTLEDLCSIPLKKRSDEIWTPGCCSSSLAMKSEPPWGDLIMLDGGPDFVGLDNQITALSQQKH